MKRTKIQNIFVSALFAAAALSLTGCGSTPKEAEINPEKAVTELAPLKSLVNKPYKGVYYSLIVRSFADSNGDGIGDFNGLTAKLDYLNDGNDATTSDLGVTGLWLLPIFPSPSYHGYDVDDYYAVNPDYGTMEDFENLVKECKKRGISVILDMTCNHSSPYNEWFQASRDVNDPHHDWYHWITADSQGYNLNQVTWGHKLWNEDFKFKGNYFSGLFDKGMPDYNMDNQDLRNEFKNVMKFWLEKGVSGFRYDAAMHVYNGAKFPAGYDTTGKGVQFWKEITDFNKSINPDVYNVGEVWDNASVRAKYMEGLGSDFDFDMGDRIISLIQYGNDGGASAYANGLKANYESYASCNPDYIDAPFLSNHDTPRAAGKLKGRAAQCKLAASLYMFTEGVPFVYYGEEIGMKSGTEDPTKRTPMIWNKTNSSTNLPKDKMQTTWLDSKYNGNTLSVAEQEKDSNSLLNYYKRIIRIRNANPALCNGKFDVIKINSDFVAGWQMVSAEQKALVLNNVSSNPVTFELPEEYKNLSLIFASDSGVVIQNGSITIPAFDTAIIAD